MSGFVPWYVDAQVEFLFEVPREQLARLVPEPLELVELRPGIALVWLGFVRFEAGNLDRLPSFHELSFNVMVHPRAELHAGRPDFACYVVAISSDCAEFDAWAQKVDRMPVTSCPALSVDFDDANIACSVHDEHGPLFTMVSSAPDAPSRTELLDIQVFAVDAQGLWASRVEWFGTLVDHQRPPHPDTRLTNHPFWCGADVGEARCFRQMHTARGESALMKIYPPQLVRAGAQPIITEAS